MKTNMRLLTSALLVLPLVGLGCGAPMMSTSSYAASLDEASAAERAAWEAFAPGRQLVLHAPGERACEITAAATFAELEKGGARVAGTVPEARVLGIASSKVHTGDGWIALEVRAVDGQTSWLRVPAGQPLGCLWPAPDGIERVLAMRGKTLKFTPWRDTCREVHAVGRSPSAALVDTEGGLALEVGGFEMGARSAAAYAKGSGGVQPWLRLNDGFLKVRADVVESCFSPLDAPEAPADITQVLHVEPSRCVVGEDRGERHVECRTSIGVWQGVIDQQSLALSLVKRTLGPVHFLKGRPVSGARYARTVVSVTRGEAKDPRGSALYRVLDTAVATAIERDGQGAVRIAPPGADDVTYRVHVDVSDILIGELTTREVVETTQYKVRDEIRPNPEKPRAVQRVEEARNRLRQEEQDYQTSLQTFERLKQEAYDQCQAAAQSADNSQTQQWMQTGCDMGAIAGQFVQPSRSGIETAQSELSEAQATLSSTPDTITVPIMADWQYKKKIYSRSTSAAISVSMQSRDAGQPITQRVPLQTTWSDYEIEPDPAHNVKGHAPNRGPIDNAEALIPFLADQASAALALRLKAAISNATIEQAMKAFVAAGNEPPKPGYEAVDALAFETAGPRLDRVLLRGKADLASGSQPFQLPANGVKLADGECLLAVAVGPTDNPIDVVLRTQNHSHGDLRAGALAVTEVCRNELSGRDAVEALEVLSNLGGSVRWGLYRSRIAAPVVAVPPGASSASLGGAAK